MLPSLSFQVLASHCSSLPRKLLISRVSSYCKRGTGKVTCRRRSSSPRPGASGRLPASSSLTAFPGASRCCCNCCCAGVSGCWGNNFASNHGKLNGKLELRKPFIATKAKTPPMARRMPKVMMPRILRSLSSCPAPAWVPVWGSRLSMFRFQHLHEVGIVNRHQRALLQPAEEEVEPDAAHGNGTDNVHSGVPEAKIDQTLGCRLSARYGESSFGAAIKVRCGDPEQIDQAHEHQHYGHGHDPPSVPLQAA